MLHLLYPCVELKCGKVNHNVLTTTVNVCSMINLLLSSGHNVLIPILKPNSTTKNYYGYILLYYNPKFVVIYRYIWWDGIDWWMKCNNQITILDFIGALTCHIEQQTRKESDSKKKLNHHANIQMIEILSTGGKRCVIKAPLRNIHAVMNFGMPWQICAWTNTNQPTPPHLLVMNLIICACNVNQPSHKLCD